MAISSVWAAAVTDPGVLGRADGTTADWHASIDHMNPLGSDRRYAGQAARFEPPWADALCLVETDEGDWGVGMTALAGPVTPIVNDFLGRMLLGEDPTDIAQLHHMMTVACASHIGLAGPASHAISAVDLALWDLAGKRAAVPVYELLGGPAHEALECYATGFDVAAYRRLGFRAVKLPCPWGPDRDESIAVVTELVRASRESIGPDAALMLDCWAVQTVDDAVAVASSVEEFDLAWIEDPIAPDDWPGYAALRERLPRATIAAGERWWGERPFAAQVAAGTVDIVQPDPLWVGGVTTTLRIAEIAADHGIEVAVHCAANDSYGQHVAHALPGDRPAEMYIASAADAALSASYRSTPGMSYPIDGRVVPSDAPGFGIELTRTDIARACAGGT